MAEKEIKIGFSEAKMEALEFFLRENDSTVEKALREHLDKLYEKSVPQQVRKFVESKLEPQQETMQEGAEPQRSGQTNHQTECCKRNCFGTDRVRHPDCG